MNYQFLLLEKQNGVGLLRLNRPERLNAFEARMVQEIPVALRELLDDDEVRAVIITGNGKGFCAGADIAYLEQLAAARDIDQGRVLVMTGSEAVELIHTAGKPVIAAINGAAAGGGASLALACDLRLMAAGARLGFPFIRLGLHPDLGCTYFLPRLVGTARAAALLLSGDMLSAEEALRLGIVNQVVPDEELLPAARRLAQALAEKSALVLRLLKKGLAQTLTQSLEAVLKYEIYAQALCFESPQAARAIAEFWAARK
ncbi:MAG: enoyl-CoA hydratase/isomerase family protein [candidate division KSB1 bacterium]|nr:enoyl-CoA hydratase/isomerase family protein [candidate division KSB1 bacterium]MDZ7272554.1 enoyl-CoA hydratase/isomerase family protein [candidate division KSB1 bacterium]MDZ7284423.1 enoyl-CoA hydratase/isomerase family protein [candidate division KSB1 bacterium]MDZ7297181.1 enoyl-CoA hydratase/isomerase family protein [candidate division KSB1 bacterium]MDZ7348048.1 enoyl-CoA hydratase/isomerase family protein [candidate division KSB1 bacterium]